MLYFVLFSNKRVTPVIYYAFLILNTIKVIKIMCLIWVNHLWLMQKTYITYPAFRVMIILRLLLLLTNLHLKLLSTQGTCADKLLSTQRVNKP